MFSTVQLVCADCMVRDVPIPRLHTGVVAISRTAHHEPLPCRKMSERPYHSQSRVDASTFKFIHELQLLIARVSRTDSVTIQAGCLYRDSCAQVHSYVWEPLRSQEQLVECTLGSERVSSKVVIQSLVHVQFSCPYHETQVWLIHLS